MTIDGSEAAKDRLVKALEAEAKIDRALLLRFVQAAERIAEGKASPMEVGGLVGQLMTVQPGSDGMTINSCSACGGPVKIVATALGHAFVACVVEPQCGMIGPTRTSASAAVAAWNRLRCVAESPEAPGPKESSDHASTLRGLAGGEDSAPDVEDWSQGTLGQCEALKWFCRALDKAEAAASRTGGQQQSGH